MDVRLQFMDFHGAVSHPAPRGEGLRTGNFQRSELGNGPQGPVLLLPRTAKSTLKPPPPGAARRNRAGVVTRPFGLQPLPPTP